MAGAPCPIEVMKQVIDAMHMSEITIGYGMTETSPGHHPDARSDDPLAKRVGTVGRVHPHVEIKIVDPGRARSCPSASQGELCTRGYQVMHGYWDNDEATTERHRRRAAGCTPATSATMDEEGYFNIVGRIKDMIIRGGENVYPREIEEFLYSHPKVADVQVIGVPDARYGEEVMAWIQLREGQEADGRGDPGLLPRARSPTTRSRAT